MRASRTDLSLVLFGLAIHFEGDEKERVPFNALTPKRGKLPGGLMRRPDSDIRTERLQIKLFTKNDAREVFDAITPTLTRYMSFEPPTSRLEFKKIWSHWLLTITDGTDLVFVIRDYQSVCFIGIVALRNSKAPDPELGIWITEREQGQGYGGEAVRAVAAWATAALGSKEFRYPVAEANGASRRIAEQMGGRVVNRKTTPKFAAITYLIRS